MFSYWHCYRSEGSRIGLRIAVLARGKAGVLNDIHEMEDLSISVSGIQKLLQNLKPGMAARPDRLKPLCWFDTAGFFKGLWWSQSLKIPLEAPPVWTQRNRTILDPCHPWEPVPDGGSWWRSTWIGPHNPWNTPGFDARTNPVPCLNQWPAVWAVSFQTTRPCYLTVGGTEDEKLL